MTADRQPDTTIGDGTIDDAVSSFLAAHGALFFVQVGGFDGVSYDPLRPHILSGRMRGLIAEPLPANFEKLQALYAGSDAITACHCAIDHEEGERPIWRFKPAAIEAGLLGRPFGGISSFVMEDLLKDDGTLGGIFSAENRTLLRTLVEPVPVRCRTFAGLLGEHGVTRIDLLQIDTEGYDLNILKMFDFQRFQPAIVHYEHQHLSPADRAEAEGMMRAMGYAIHHNVHDTLAVRGVTMPPPARVADPALAVARGLYDQGRAAEALAVCDYVLAVDRHNSKALHLAAAALKQTGRIGEGLRHMGTLLATGKAFDPALPGPDDFLEPAVALYNELFAQGDTAAWTALLDSLLPLFPQAADLLSRAYMGHLALGRTEQAMAYAAQLLEVNPGHVAARRNMAEHFRNQGDYAREVEHRIQLTQAHMASDLPSSIKLDNIVHTLGRLLSAPPTDGLLTLARQLLAYARTLEADDRTQADPYLSPFDAFYRATVHALDLETALAPSPEPRPWPDAAFASADGRPMTLAGVQELAARERAQAVFLVAADEVFLTRYGGTSIASILDRADVSCLVLVLAAVPTARLTELGAALGIDDRRVVFFGDGFVPAPDAYHSVNPQGVHATPAVYYQCMRFLWLGYVLEELRLPTLVCDIDIVLQRGIADLLERCAPSDVTLHRSRQLPELSTHIVANLLLLNPTDKAVRYARYLRGWLERALTNRPLPAFLDQLALHVGLQHLHWVLEAEVGYFQQLDINYLMFTKENFAEHAEIAGRFRFINLFASQGEQSLDPAAATADEPVPA